MGSDTSLLSAQKSAQTTGMESYQELYLPLEVVQSSPGFSFDIGKLMLNFLKMFGKGNSYYRRVFHNGVFSKKSLSLTQEILGSNPAIFLFD